MEIPPNLQEQARQGRVILLLGAGASLDAKDANGNKPPSGAGLAKKLSEKFLGGQFNDADLGNVSEYAVSEHSLLAVQQEIHDIFVPFEPTDAHKLLPNFSWAGLATTNYDLLVEKAYSLSTSSLQIPVPFIENGDQIIESLRDPKAVRYLKLHGCISRIANGSCPLILTKDQYITYRKGRSRLFQVLNEWAYEHPIVFVGHSGQDPDIREMIFEIDQALESRPRHFIVAPQRSEIEKRFWETKRVTALDGTFLDFLHALDSAIGNEFRGLRIETVEPHGISRHFRVTGAVLSKNCSEFLATDACYVQSCQATKKIDPRDFYRGYNAEWEPIEQELDVKRPFIDDILEDVFLINDLQERKPLEVVLLKGYAGSGTTVSLRRLAWQAAKVYDTLCLYLNDAASVNIGAIQELVGLCKERVFLFIDNAPDRSPDVRKVIRELSDAAELVTIIIAARHNEWNTVHGDIQGAITSEYEVPRLRECEISDLIGLLTKHKALGRLENKTLDEQIHAFDSLAGRQLLVALHEATLGIPFEEIIENEYKNLVPDEAQRLYLTVCILNRLDVPVRAGLVARIHGIPFTAFKERLFKPLEHVVYDSFDARIHDQVYKARHPVIAEIVFERILTDQSERFQEYYRCLTALNIDYSTDDKAFRQLIRGRVLLDLFSNPEYCYAILDKATEMAGETAPVLQQKALYEMHRPGGNLANASKYIERAIVLQPYNRTLKHTLSELALKKAETARTDLERDKFLREAAETAAETKGRRQGETHAHHTIAKANIKRIEVELEAGNSDFSHTTLQNYIRSVETEIAAGLQMKPGDPYLLSEQARLARLLQDTPRARASLEKAVAHNSKLTFLAVQLAECQRAEGDLTNARKTYENALNTNRNDRVLNYRYACFLEDIGGDRTTIIYYLKRAFSPGDQNFDAQLRYARALFLDGDYDGARQEFQGLRFNKSPYYSGQRLYEVPGFMTGKITGVRHTNLFVQEQQSQQFIFIPRTNVNVDDWRHLTEGRKVRFILAFNLRGPIGFECGLAP